MKQVFSLLIAFSLGLVTVMAQPGQGERKEMTPEQQVERLDRVVDLTEIQKEELEVIFTESKRRSDEIRTSMTMEEGEPALKDLRKETFGQVKSVLTEDQLALLEEKRKGSREGQRGPR